MVLKSRYRLNYHGRMKTIRAFVFCYSLLHLFAVNAQSSLEKPIVKSSLDDQLFYQLLLGELELFDGKVGVAFNTYVDAARRNPSDELFERGVRISLDARDGNTARQFAGEWTRRMKDSALAHRYLYQILFAQSQYAAAMPPLKEHLRLSEDPQRSAIISGLTQYFSMPSDKTAAASELNRVLEPYYGKPSTNEASRLVYSRALLAAAQFNDALGQLNLLTQQHPKQLDGWLLLGSLQVQENQFDAAEKSLLHFVQIAKESGLASNHAGYVQAYLHLAQLAENRKDYVAAQEWLSKIEDDKERLTAQLRRASILAKQGKLDEARVLISQLPEPTQAQARAKLLAEVQLLRDHKQIPTAIALMEKALADAPKDTGLMYELSTLHDKQKEYAKMEALLRNVIALEPSHQGAYNALGYSFADRGVRLDEAKALIQKALAITPNDPYIADSLGWVEFRMGKYEDALKTLQAAYKTRADAEIGAHAGEVLWQLNRKEEALKIWREAKTINAENETLLETLKRLGVNL
jgi:tetratricopeptide (TPR) repeat protein